MQLILLQLFYHTRLIQGLVIGGQSKSSICKDSLQFDNGVHLSGVGQTDLTHEISTTFVFTTCSCFRLFARKGGKGKSQILLQPGFHKIQLGKVGSVAKASCSWEKYSRIYYSNKQFKQVITTCSYAVSF